MSKWDWLHAGLEAATYIEAQKARKNLEAMQTANEIEIAKNILLEAMKNFVFDISRDIQLTEEQIEQSPQQAYIVSKVLDLRFSKSGLSADLFPDFQDKEYVFKTQRKIKEVFEKSKKQLSRQYIEDAEKAINYLSEIPLLQKAIISKKAQEQLSESEEDWLLLEQQQKQKGPYIIFITIFITIVAIIGAISNNDFIARSSLIGIIGAFVLLFFILSTSPEYKALRDEREKLWKEVTPEDEPQETISDTDWQNIISLMDNSTSEQLEKIYNEQVIFLKNILGDSIQSKKIKEAIFKEETPQKTDAITSLSTENGALEEFGKLVAQEKLTKTAEEYFEKGLKYMESLEFEEAILEFIKVIKLASPKTKIYQSARHQLITMGFSEEDIQRV